MQNTLLPIPAKRYFTIGEVSDLCCVKPHVLRYWEQEFTQLSPMKRRGNRRYYQHHEVLMIRKIRELLYDQGFTISGARNKMLETSLHARDKKSMGAAISDGVEAAELTVFEFSGVDSLASDSQAASSATNFLSLRQELLDIRSILSQGL
jgi:DNA-binding transcriptional MerR regulator